MIDNWREKRVFPRIAVKTPLSCQIRGAKETDRTISTDISETGIGFNSDTFVAPNTRINLEFNLMSQYITTKSRIVRSNYLPRSNKYRLGVEFIEIERNQQKYLSDFIRMKLDENHRKE